MAESGESDFIIKNGFRTNSKREIASSYLEGKTFTESLILAQDERWRRA